MAVDLTGRRALVTGGGRGIGRAISKALSAAGADVAVNFVRSRKDSEALCEELREAGGTAIAVRANVADPEHVERMYGEIREEWGGLDILVSNAATGVIKPAEELTPKHLRHTMEASGTALLGLAQGAADLMGDWGRVIAISSTGAERAIPGYAAVGAAKGALESIARHLALEWAGRGIGVNIVCPGVVDTDALKFFPHRDELIQESKRRTPAGRLCTVDDVADAVLLLCSPLADFIQGETVHVDGGYHIVS